MNSILLGKQYTPLKPKPNPYLRRSQNELEPLYRRARYASHLREMVKVTPERVNSQSMMYKFEDTRFCFLIKKNLSIYLNFIVLISFSQSTRRASGGLQASKPLFYEEVCRQALLSSHKIQIYIKRHKKYLIRQVAK